MAKIRGFKPDLWTDEDFVEVSAFARLLWLGMWNYACDNGHLPDKSKQIKMRVLPTDDINCAELLRELEDQGLIERAEGWITIPNLTHHQKPNRHYFTVCEKPLCTKPEGDPKRETPGGQRGATLHNGAQRKAPGDGDGDGEVKVNDGDGKGATQRRRQLPADWSPNETHRAYGAEHQIDLDEQVAAFRDHHAAKGSTMKDWDAAFRTWLRNAVKWRKDEPKRPAIRSLPHASELELAPDGMTDEESYAWQVAQAEKRRAAR